MAISRMPGRESALVTTVANSHAPSSLLLAAQRTASLRHDDESLSTLINLLLRNYLAYDLHSQADKLVSKTTFGESMCRYWTTSV